VWKITNPKVIQRIREDFTNEKEIQTLLTNHVTNKDRIGFVTCQDYFEDKDHYYLVMEYCKDGELFGYVSQYHKKKLTMSMDPLEWIERVRHIFRQIVFAVAFMHNHHIAHQDLSLENTMIFDSNSLHVKVIDFGLAIQIKEKRKRQGRVGKEAYMSPECYSSQEYDPYKNDLWCLGAMLFIMLIGGCPPVRDRAQLSVILNGYLYELLKNVNRLHEINVASLDCLNRLLRLEANRMTLNELLAHPFVCVNAPLDSPMGCIERARKFISYCRKLKPSTSEIQSQLTQGQKILSELGAYKKQLLENKNDVLHDEQINNPSKTLNFSTTPKENQLLIQMINERIDQLTPILKEMNQLLSQNVL